MTCIIVGRVAVHSGYNEETVERAYVRKSENGPANQTRTITPGGMRYSFLALDQPYLPNPVSVASCHNPALLLLATESSPPNPSVYPESRRFDGVYPGGNGHTSSYTHDCYASGYTSGVYPTGYLSGG